MSGAATEIGTAAAAEEQKKTAAMTKTHEICELCARFSFNSFV